MRRLLFLRQQDELETRLQTEFGFHSIAAENLSPQQQALAFANAECVVGVFGAGFTNIGYCVPGTAVVELRVDQYDDPWILHLCARLGLRYACVTGAPDTTQIGWTKLGDRDYMERQVFDIDIEFAIAAVRGLLEGKGFGSKANGF